MGFSLVVGCGASLNRETDAPNAGEPFRRLHVTPHGLREHFEDEVEAECQAAISGYLGS